MRVADTVRCFLLFPFMKGRILLLHFTDVVGNFELKKITPNYNALAKWIISCLGVS